jgi:hypothetical protein
MSPQAKKGIWGLVKIALGAAAMIYALTMFK